MLNFQVNLGIFLLGALFVSSTSCFPSYSENSLLPFKRQVKPMYFVSDVRPAWSPYYDFDELNDYELAKRSRTHMPYHFG
ncbi:unnamed protein product [Hymenolepis diminuta]|uniref:Uncharacterized protein n=1 Tax=Hymenolepis diminuta TaxID=6216 RepID=A0A564XZB8_HYMDI|nr:unnamed protein product [Hymenolepis diminuta]